MYSTIQLAGVVTNAQVSRAGTRPRAASMFQFMMCVPCSKCVPVYLPPMIPALPQGEASVPDDDLLRKGIDMARAHGKQIQ